MVRSLPQHRAAQLSVLWCQRRPELDQQSCHTLCMSDSPMSLCFLFRPPVLPSPDPAAGLPRLPHVPATLPPQRRRGRRLPGGSGRQHGGETSSTASSAGFSPPGQTVTGLQTPVPDRHLPLTSETDFFLLFFHSEKQSIHSATK